VIIESPYKGNVEEHVKYAKRCLLDSISRGEAPFASHLLYTLVLDDENLTQRTTGIECGFRWREGASLTAVYTDYGISKGMEYGIADAEYLEQKIEYREIGKNE